MTTYVPVIDASTHGHWPAQLDLRFQQSPDGGCKLAYNRHDGPLYVQRPFYPEGKGLAHVYVLHPPGGLVSGDQLHIRLVLEPHSQVLCTTPGAARLYRARTDRRLQQQHCLLQVGEGASLEWMPLETIAFRGAHARLTTEVQLAKSARFSGWEITVLGHVANHVRFDDGVLTQRFRIFRDGVPLLMEQLRLDGEDAAFAHGSAALRGMPVYGVFVSGPFDHAALQQLDLASLQAELPEAAREHCGLTRLGTFIVGRYLGDCAQEARICFTQWWHALRPLLLQRPPCNPRIWNT